MGEHAPVAPRTAHLTTGPGLRSARSPTGVLSPVDAGDPWVGALDVLDQRHGVGPGEAVAGRNGAVTTPTRPAGTPAARGTGGHLHPRAHDASPPAGEARSRRGVCHGAMCRWLAYSGN